MVPSDPSGGHTSPDGSDSRRPDDAARTERLWVSADGLPIAAPVTRRPQIDTAAARRRARYVITSVRALRSSATSVNALWSKLRAIPLSVVGLVCIDFAAFHLAHGWGWLVTGLSLFVLELMLADDDSAEGKTARDLERKLSDIEFIDERARKQRTVA